MLKLILLLSLCFLPSTHRFYDKNGKYVGKTIKQNDTKIRIYNKNGKYQGKIIKDKNKVRFYDKNGRYKGKMK